MIDIKLPFRQFEWNIMPFSLKNVPFEFGKIMNDIFNHYIYLIIIYIVDVLIYSKALNNALTT